MANNIRNNIGQFQKYATIYITKQLQAVAENTGVNVRKVVADKLEETYKKNIQMSYTSKSIKGWNTDYYNSTKKYGERKQIRTYHHTNTLLDSIKTVIEGNYVKIKIDGRRRYKKYGNNKSVPVTTVYKWLTKGTKTAHGQNYAYTTKDGTISGGRNYPTERHEFELWTQLEMKGFLQSLKADIDAGKYTTYKYTGKKKSRIK